MFNMFEELFAPGRKHTHDENKRLELTRVDVDDGDPGRGPIDLSSGKVVVRLPTQAQTQEEEPAQGKGTAGPDSGAEAGPRGDGAESGPRDDGAESGPS